MYKLTVLFYLKVLTALTIVSADIHRIFKSTGKKNLQAEINNIIALYTNKQDSKYLTNNRGGESRPVLN
jgi:hypothetical protein